MRYFNCKVCRKRLKPAQRRTLLTEGHKPLIKYLKKIMLIEQVGDCDVICVTCRLSFTKEMTLKKNTNSGPKHTNPVPVSVRSPTVRLPFPGTSRSHSTCCVCKRSGKLTTLSAKARYSCLVETQVFVPNGARCCRDHLHDGHLTPPSLQLLLNKSGSETHTTVSSTEHRNVLQHVVSVAKKSSMIDFDGVYAMSDEDYMNLTGKFRTIPVAFNYLM